MTLKERNRRLKIIKETLKYFPKVVAQNVKRGKSHRKLMKAFEPMARDLEKRIKRNRKPAS